jgi:hypothetical protein
MSECIINYADDKHVIAQERLKKSLELVGFKGRLLLWTNKMPKNCPPHDYSPWAFKAFCFKEAIEQGFTKILWVDSSVYFIRNPQRIFEKINKDGYFILSNYVSSVGDWSSDFALEKLGIDRKETYKITEIRAHIIGLDINSDIAKNFFNLWLEEAKDGRSFRGLPTEYKLADTFINNGIISTEKSVKGHRHDQTVASIIAWKLGMRPVNKYSIDLVGEINGSMKPIPLDTIVLQDRSYKNGGECIMIDKYQLKVGARRMIYVFVSFIYTLLRNVYNNKISY